MRKKIVAGNWKMNKMPSEALELAQAVIQKSTNLQDVSLILCPPSLYIQNLVGACTEEIAVGAQNCHQNKSGAYTGELSAKMLIESGVKYCLVGHSERRAIFHETDEIVAEKFEAIRSAGMIPILCCGETIDQRKSGTHKKTVLDQISKVIPTGADIDGTEFIIAYEPVWAIGTGETATPDQAQEMHAVIREHLNELIGNEAELVSILYGGSCKPDNANDLFRKADIDGGLIGGASLDADSFISIADSF